MLLRSEDEVNVIYFYVKLRLVVLCFNTVDIISIVSKIFSICKTCLLALCISKTTNRFTVKKNAW